MQNSKGHVNVFILRSKKELKGVGEKNNESIKSEETQPTWKVVEE